MTQNDRAIFRIYLRFAALVCLAWGAGPGIVQAMTRVEVYQATVPLTDNSENAHAAAFQAAMRVVLVRATGRRGADEDPVFAPLVSNARRYVQQYRGAPDNQLWVAFDGSALERWLTQNSQPLWGRDRPSTFVWLTVQNGAQTMVVSADDSSELKLAVDAAAAERGIPLIWPGAEAAAAPGAVPLDIGRRLGAEGVLIGRANGATAAATVRWSLQFQDKSSDFAGALEGVNRAADLYAATYAASGSLAPVDIEVAGVSDVHDYAGVEVYLESLSFVTHVSVDSLSGDTVRFRVTTRGGIEPLQHAIVLSGRMQPLPTGPNGIARFQVRR